MRWSRRRYRGHKVWIRVEAGGEPYRDERGLVPLRYRADDERAYTVRPEELRPLPAAAADGIDLWVALASGADAAGVAAVLRWGDHVRERSRRVGLAPDVALAAEAVILGLDAVRRPEVAVRLRGPAPDADALPRDLGARLQHALERLSVVSSETDPEAPEAVRAVHLARAAAAL